MHYKKSNLFLKSALILAFIAGIISPAAGQYIPYNDTTSEFSSILNKFGRIETFDGSGGNYLAQRSKMIHYLMPQFGVNDTLVWHVWRAPEDPVADSTYFPGADTTKYHRYVLTDDSFNQSKTMEVELLLRLWKDRKFGLARFNVIQRLDTTRVLKQSALMRAKFNNEFTAQVLRYSGNQKRLYINDDDNWAGMVPLDTDPVSVRFIDDEQYDNTAPNEDNASDSLRWVLMNESGFASDLSTGEQGGWAFMNFGQTDSMALNDTSGYWVAFSHGATRTEVDSRLTAAEDKYRKVITSLQGEGGSALITRPERIELHQNYPNPFNPETHIPFSLSKPSHVRLVVYDITGKRVAQVVGRNFTAGNHTLTFTAENLSSGVYMYRLTAGEVAREMKMVLIK